MTYPDLEQARSCHAALRECFYRDADWSDPPVLRRVQSLCRAAREAVPDAQCHEELRLVADYAAELVSASRHEKYESQSLSGTEFLRLQILRALDSFNSRIYSLEAIRRTAQFQVTRPAAR
jgi:hypothetical protein